MRTHSVYRNVFAFLLLPLASASAQTTQPVKAPAPTSSTVNILAMGDWGTNGKDQHQVAEEMSAYVKASGKTPDAMVLVGDNFYMKLPGGIKDPIWQSAFEKMYDPATLNMPFYAVLGNHDYQDGKDKIELGYSTANPDSRFKMPARWYRVDFPPINPQVTVFMLDSDKDPLGKDLWAQEKQWLTDEMAKPRGHWTLCCAHHTLFSNGGHGDNAVLQREWGPMLTKNNVDFYVCGHDHDLQHLQIPNWFTSFLLVGGGGAETKMMRHDDRGPMSRLTHGFADLSFTGDVATISYITAEGKTLHAFTRDKAGKITVQIEGGDDKAAINPLKALEGIGGYKPPTTKPADAKQAD